MVDEISKQKEYLAAGQQMALSETLNKSLKSLDNFTHTWAFDWIILNHIIDERSHKFESFISTDVGKDGVSQDLPKRKREEKFVRSNDDLTCMNSVRIRLPT